MTGTLRPIGPVTESLRKQGYRQYAAIFVDGKQVAGVAVLSTLDSGKTKFVGHWVDDKGDAHTTKPMADMKKAANRIMTIRDNGTMIDCKGCGTRHSDETMCPE